MSLSERKKRKPAKVWDTVKNWIAGDSRSSRQKFRSYNNGQELPITVRASSNTRRERRATTGSTSQAPRRVDYEWCDMGEIGKWATVIEERVAKLERLLQQTTERSRSPRDDGFLTGQVVELLQEKTDELSNVERIAHGEIAREELIMGLEPEVAQLNRLLREKAVEHFSAERATNKQIEEQKREIARLKAEVAQLNRLLREKTAEHFSAERAANEQIEEQKREIGRLKEVIHSASAQKQREEKRTEIAPRHSTENEQANKLSSPTIAKKVATISVAEVADLLRMLHSQIEQTTNRIMHSPSYRESPISSEELQEVLNELNDYIGPWLCNDLRSKSEFNMETDSVITELTLQTGLVNSCFLIINFGVPFADGVILSPTRGNMAGASQTVVNTRKALACTYTTASESESSEVTRKYLTGIMHKLITVVGGSLESKGALNEEIGGIVNKALELHRIISRDAASMELITYTIPCGARFDPSRMKDTEDETKPITQDTVVCTLDMGLQCRKRVESGSGEEWSVTMKAKVALASMLEV